MDIYIRKRNSALSMLWVGTFFFGLLIGFSFCYAVFVPHGEPDTGAQFAGNPQTIVEPAAPASTPEVTPPLPETPEPQAQPVSSPPETAASETPVEPPSDLEDLEDTWAARHFFVAVSGTKLDDPTRAMLAELKPGGVVLTSGNLDNKIQTIALVKSIKDAVGLGKETDSLPLIAVSLEGSGTTDLPSLADVSRHRDLEYARSAGLDLAKQFCGTRGIGVLLGPSLDVYTDGAPEAVKVASFEGDYRTVSSLGLAFAEGVTQGSVIPVVTHFPGLGSAQGDGRDSVAVLGNSVPLGEVIFPFNEAATHDVPGILVSHVAVPELDSDFPQRPASLSPKLAHDLLRLTWNYSGVVMADDLSAKAILGSRSLEEAAVQAFSAGCDAVIVLDTDLDHIRAAVAAVDAAAAAGTIDRRAFSAGKKRLDAWQQWLRKPVPGLKGSLPELPPLEVAAAPGTEHVAETAPATQRTYTVSKGDSLYKIAEANNVSIKDLQDWNKLRGSTLQVGQSLVLSAPVAAAPANVAVAPRETTVPESTPAPAEPNEPADSSDTGDRPANTKPVTHKVKAGEYLATIADQYKVDYRDIMKWNRLTKTNIYAGQNLTIYVPSDVAPESEGDAADPPSEVEYTVQRGDFLGKIADRYGVTVKNLMEWNGLTSIDLEVGQKLRIKIQ